MATEQEGTPSETNTDTEVLGRDRLVHETLSKVYNETLIILYKAKSRAKRDTNEQFIPIAGLKDTLVSLTCQRVNQEQIIILGDIYVTKDLDEVTRLFTLAVIRKGNTLTPWSFSEFRWKTEGISQCEITIDETLEQKSSEDFRHMIGVISKTSDLLKGWDTGNLADYEDISVFLENQPFLKEQLARSRQQTKTPLMS